MVGAADQQDVAAKNRQIGELGNLNFQLARAYHSNSCAKEATIHYTKAHSLFQ
jgi:hypothetical protein